MQENMLHSPLLWLVLAWVAGTLLKFLRHALWYRAFKAGRALHSKPLPGPQLHLAVPETETQPQHEINAERVAAYRMSGLGLMVLCFISGAVLIAGAMLMMSRARASFTDADSIANAAPGAGLVVLGLLVWRLVRE